MNCSQVQESLSAYYDDQLAPELHASVAQHLEGCPSCARELEDFRKLTALSAQLDDPPTPSSCWTRLEKELDATETCGTVAPAPIHKRFPTSIAAIAAVLVIGVGIGLVALQMRPKQSHHDVAANMARYLDEFLGSPDKAQRAFLARHRAEAVNLQKPTQLARYQAIVASHVPQGYSLDALHVFDMEFCTCGETPCVCDHETCTCAHATYKRNGSETLVVLQHDIDQPMWFRGLPTLNCRFSGKPTRIVQLDDTRLAATWPVDGTYVTLIGARDIEEVTQFIAGLSD